MISGISTHPCRIVEGAGLIIACQLDACGRNLFIVVEKWVTGRISSTGVGHKLCLRLLVLSRTLLESAPFTPADIVRVSSHNGHQRSRGEEKGRRELHLGERISKTDIDVESRSVILV